MSTCPTMEDCCQWIPKSCGLRQGLLPDCRKVACVCTVCMYCKTVDLHPRSTECIQNVLILRSPGAGETICGCLLGSGFSHLELPLGTSLFVDANYLVCASHALTTQSGLGFQFCCVLFTSRTHSPRSSPERATAAYVCMALGPRRSRPPFLLQVALSCCSWCRLVILFSANPFTKRNRPSRLAASKCVLCSCSSCIASQVRRPQPSQPKGSH